MRTKDRENPQTPPADPPHVRDLTGRIHWHAVLFAQSDPEFVMQQVTTVVSPLGGLTRDWVDRGYGLPKCGLLADRVGDPDGSEPSEAGSVPGAIPRRASGITIHRPDG